MRGFTLIEILLVIAIIGLLAFLCIPLGLELYRSQQLDTTADGLVQALARARSKAISGEFDSNFGIYLSENKYILYKGQSFDLRDQAYDEVFEPAGNIIFSGLSQLNFSKISGQPSQIGKIIISNNQDYLVLDINQAGVTTLLTADLKNVVLRPNSPGFSCNITGQSNCSACPNHYTCVDEDINPDNDSVFLWQQTSYLTDLYNIADYFQADMDFINYFDIHFRVNGGVLNKQYYGWVVPVIRYNGTIFEGSEINLSSYGQNLSGQPPLDLFYRWTQKPDGQQWQLSDINNLEIGFKIKCAGSQLYYINAYQIYAEISYLDVK